jgi:hypothetical protein
VISKASTWVIPYVPCTISLKIQLVTTARPKLSANPTLNNKPASTTQLKEC